MAHDGRYEKLDDSVEVQLEQMVGTEYRKAPVPELTLGQRLLV